MRAFSENNLICRSSAQIFRIFSLMEFVSGYSALLFINSSREDLDSFNKLTWKNQKKNYIWDFFEKSTSDLFKAKCNKCHKLYSLGSSEPKRQTIHGLKLHLSKFHGEENRQYLKRQAEKEEQKLEAKLKKRKSEISIATGSTNNSSGGQLVQTTIFKMEQARALKASEWPDDHEISRRIDKSIMDLIIVDMLPYSIVDSEAFRRLNFSDPHSPQKYNFKSEKYFRTTLMPQTYEIVSKKSLVIKDALFSEERHEIVIKTCRKIVGHFKRSEQASRKLIECQKQCGIPTHSLIQDVEVRWNSTYNMLERKLQFRDENESEVMKSMKTKLHESMNRRFAYVQGHAALITSTLLDPRFKNTYLNSDEVDVATMEIENHMRFYADNSRETAGTSGQEPSSSYRLSPYEKYGGLWDVHDKSNSQAIQSSDASDEDDLSTQVLDSDADSTFNFDSDLVFNFGLGSGLISFPVQFPISTALPVGVVIRCWPVSRAADFITMTATLHFPASPIIGREPSAASLL
ncbi:Zinc finger BED domain-containing protein 4 [Eumeta japonica]|uniref:Zinc finger BED domain-containing protein 4 n=1 Tax=Eumeta variegata TaxID=151549 RepID=A0A4C1VGY1_EUMVA|nr:Zinc finger BED domain-containing protein 4 [Eumeta japonica]